MPPDPLMSPPGPLTYTAPTTGLTVKSQVRANR